MRVPPGVRASAKVAFEYTSFGQLFARQVCTIFLSFVQVLALDVVADFERAADLAAHRRRLLRELGMPLRVHDRFIDVVRRRPTDGRRLPDRLHRPSSVLRD
jgi:hypothetical protein